MPTLSIIAVFCHIFDSEGGKHGWFKLKFADQSESEACWIRAGQMITLSQNLDTSEWFALQKALQNQGQWIPVE